MLIFHETYDHWSVAVVTVTVHDSFFPLLIFLKYVAFCTGFNLLTFIFLLPYIIMDLPIFGLKTDVGLDRPNSGVAAGSSIQKVA